MTDQTKDRQLDIPPFNPLLHPLIGTTPEHTLKNLYSMFTLLLRILEHNSNQCPNTPLQTFTEDEKHGLNLMCELLQQAISAIVTQCETKQLY